MSSNAQERLLAALTEAIAAIDPGFQVVSLTVTATDPAGHRLTLTLDAQATRQEGLTERVLRVLGEAKAPLKGASIARRAGVTYSGGFKKALADLVREGEVQRRAEGYWLAGRAMGEEAA